MKLTNKDKEYLKSIGYPDNELNQIEKATGSTVYKFDDTKRISCRKAIELLGRESFLATIGRSAFHWNSSAETKDGKHFVCFDSSRMFK